MKPEPRDDTRPRKAFVEPRIERHGTLPEVTGASFPARPERED